MRPPVGGKWLLLLAAPALAACAAYLDRAPAPGGLRPHRLRCEYLVDPLGIDLPHPRLSGAVAAPARSERQTAYRIVVAASAGALAAGRGELWDSGKVISDQSIHVPYRGRSLPSHQRCFWRVRVWDREGRPSHWSATGRWTMGILDEAGWQARWIGHTPPAPLLRRAFRLPAKPLAAAGSVSRAFGRTC